MNKSKEEVLKLPLLERAQLAGQAAIEKVIEEYRKAGLPLTILRDGKIVEVTAEELLANGTEHLLQRDQS